MYVTSQVSVSSVSVMYVTCQCVRSQACRVSYRVSYLSEVGDVMYVNIYIYNMSYLESTSPTSSEVGDVMYVKVSVHTHVCYDTHKQMPHKTRNKRAISQV